MIFFVSILSSIIKDMLGFLYQNIFSVFFIGIILYKDLEGDILISITTTLISSAINYIMFSISIFISYIIHNVFKIDIEILNFIIIYSLYATIYAILMFRRKFKNGFKLFKGKIKNTKMDLVIVNFSVIVLFLIAMLSAFNNKKIGHDYYLIGFVMISIITMISIKESLDAYYKHNMLVKELEETKKKLAEKEKENKELEEEILGFNKRSHTIAHKQKALEYKIEQLMLSGEENKEIKEDIEEISKDINVKNKTKLDKTGIEKIDSMIAYMKNEADKKEIDFKLKIQGNIYSMINNYIDAEDLETLLADHLKDAIISIENSNNKNRSILLRIGKIDGTFGMYIYDSGIEFEVDTYLKLGKEPITTHKDKGGTGMGFMNTFDTLKKVNASLYIKELGKESLDNYTKVIMIKFNNKNEFKIKSYRSEEIILKDNKKILKIDKI